ncbi:hypothetical protein N302_01179, partial [Corvus brachyrhynchos]
QTVRNHGPVTVKSPFSVVHLMSWKQAAGVYREDLDRVAKVFETIIRTQDPDWNDIQVMLDMLLDNTEKMVLSTARKQVKGAHTNGDLEGTVDQNFPSTDPRWDPNLPGTQVCLTRYQRWVLFGVKHAILKAMNWSKLYEVKQDDTESPTTFM